jgi:hypothetical protein
MQLEEVAVATPIQLEQLALLLEAVDQEELLAMLPPATREALAAAESPEALTEDVITKVAEAVFSLMEAQRTQA